MDIINCAKSTLDASLSLNKEFINDKSNTCIILSAFNYKNFNELKQKYNKIIVYNFEPYNSKFLKDKNYINLLKNTDEVWDYDEENIKQLSNIRNDIKLHILKPFINISEQQKEYDILFYGIINPRRKYIIETLIKEGINIKYFSTKENAIFGDELNTYIAKSKCLLNIHFHESSLQEQARMIRWINNGKIFSEKSIHNYLNIDEYEYDNLIPSIKQYLNK